MDLRANTAVDVLIGPFVDATDGNTTEDGLTLTQAEIKLSKNGQALAQKNDATSAVFDDDGYYNCELDATDTNTEGQLVLIVHQSANALPVRHEYNVMSEAAWDSIYVAKDTGFMDVNIKAISEDETAADNLELMYNGTGYTDDTAPSSRLQVGNLSVGSGGISTTAESFTKAGAEPETNTFTATVSEDGTFHIVEDDATSTDVYYQFDIGGSGIPQSVTWVGYAQSNGDSYTVHFWNWAGASYDQVGSITASNGTTASTETYTATTAHVGTGADLGKVRFRFLSSDGTAIATDRVIVTYTFSNQSIGYAGGAVWIDTNASNTNTESFVDGTADNPVSTIAAATTIADNLNLRIFHSIPGSSFTLAQGYDGYEFIGIEYTLNLGSQAIPNTLVEGAMIAASSCTGSGIIFRECIFDENTTLPPCVIRGSFFGNATTTAGSAGNFYINSCRSRVAGAGAPTFDMGAAVGASNVSIRDFSGGWTINNIASGDILSIGGPDLGTPTLNGADGTVDLRGTGKPVVDNRTGSPTLTTTGYTHNIVGDEITNKGLVRTVYVDTGGDDANDGLSRSNPKLTIAAAVTAASAGDTIAIGAGTFVDSLTITKRLTLQGVGETSTIIEADPGGTTALTLNTDCDHMIIRDLTVEYSSADAAMVRGIGISTSNAIGVLIENCHVKGGSDGIFAASCHRIEIRNCRVEGGIDGLTLPDCRAFLIENCDVVCDGSNDATSLGVCIRTETILTNEGASGTIRNCNVQFERSDTDSGYMRGFWGGRGVTIENTSFNLSQASTGSGEVVGIKGNHANDRVALNNVYISTSSGGAGSVNDMDFSTGESISVAPNCFYDTSKVTPASKIFVTGSGGVSVEQISRDATAAGNAELFFDNTGFVASNSTIGTVTANTDMRGTDNAATASDLATVDANVDTLITNVPDVLSLANINAQVDGSWTTQMADSVSTDGTVATREQAVYMILQTLTDFSISGTTLTINKVDGSTPLFTLTLNDATTPTSATRAT